MDTIGIIKELGQSDINQVVNCLDNPRFTTYDSGLQLIRGNLANLFVSINQDTQKLRIENSLSRFYNGSNLTTLSRLDTKQAIEKMEDSLHINLQDALITRLDFALNFETNYTPKKYLGYLGQLQYYDRIKQSDSLYYNTKNKVIVFYDKIKELKSKKQLYQNRTNATHLLRCEFRLLKRLDKFFNMPKVQVCHLSNEATYRTLLSEFKGLYNRINKQTEPLNPKLLNDMKDFENTILVNGLLATFGSQAKALEYIETQQIKNRTHKKRLKDKIKKAFSNPTATKESELITELNQKFNQAIELFLN